MGVLAQAIASFHQVRFEARSDPVLRTCCWSGLIYPSYLALGSICGHHYSRYLARRQKDIERKSACGARLVLGIDKEAAEKDDWQKELVAAVAQALDVLVTRLSIQCVSEARGETFIRLLLAKSLDVESKKAEPLPCNILWTRLKLGTAKSGPLADVTSILVDGTSGTEDDDTIKLYSYWLVPAGKPKEACDKLIKKLSEDLGGPSFQPHVTLMGAVEGHEEDVKAAAERFGKEVAKMPITFSRVARGSSYFRSLYLEAAQTESLNEAHTKIQQMLPCRRLPKLLGGRGCQWLDVETQQNGFFPHLSLAYTKKREAADCAAVETLNPALLEELAFTASEIVVWETDAKDETCKSWKEVARYKLEGKPRPSFWFLFKRFATVAAPEFAQIGVGTLLSFATGLICERACDHDQSLYSGAHVGKSNAELLQTLLHGLALWGVVDQGFTWSHKIIENAGRKIGGRLKERVFDSFMKQDVKWIQQKGAEELHKTLMERTSKVEQMFTHEIPGMVKMITDVVINIGLLWLRQPRLCLFGFGIFAFQNMNGDVFNTIHSIAEDHEEKVEESMGASPLEVLQNFRTVRAFVREEKEKESYRKSLWGSLRIRCSDIVEKFTDVGRWFGYEFCWQISYVYGGMLVNMGQIKAGEVKDAMTKARRCIWPLYQMRYRLTRKSTFAEDAAAVLEALERLPDIPYEDQTKYNPKPHEVRGEIEAVNLSFTYADDSDTKALKDVSFKIAAGSMVGLVGPSGCGKSTMFNLLLRFYDAQGGSLKVDGVDLAQWNPQALYRAVAWVSQDQAVFAGSVLDNIRYGVPEATEEDVLRVMREAALYDDVIKKEKGVLTRASELSGGQKQRLSIARALLRNPKILLLDEATSALDTASERQVQKAFEGLMKGRTVIAIAHRLSTIMNSDLILVMEDGTVIEKGPHAELLKKSGGKYADLVHQQLAVDDDKAKAETATDPQAVKDAAFGLNQLMDRVPAEVRDDLKKAVDTLKNAAEALQNEKKRLSIREQSLLGARRPWKAAKSLVPAMSAIRRMQTSPHIDLQSPANTNHALKLERALSKASILEECKDDPAEEIFKTRSEATLTPPHVERSVTA